MWFFCAQSFYLLPPDTSPIEKLEIAPASLISSGQRTQQLPNYASSLYQPSDQLPSNNTLSQWEIYPCHCFPGIDEDLALHRSSWVTQLLMNHTAGAVHLCWADQPPSKSITGMNPMRQSEATWRHLNFWWYCCTGKGQEKGGGFSQSSWPLIAHLVLRKGSEPAINWPKEREGTKGTWALAYNSVLSPGTLSDRSKDLDNSYTYKQETKVWDSLCP